jgi:hypothetical protein
MIASLLALALAGADVAASSGATVTCGAVERPGIAERGEDGGWRGIAIALCRKKVQAARGIAAPIVFHAYRTADDLRASVHDFVSVLSAAELAIARPDSGDHHGAPVAISRQVLLVPANKPVADAKALAGQTLCFIMATEAERALNQWIKQTGMAIRRVGFQEPVELRDALDAGYCAAMAVDADDIPGGPARTRQLGPALAELPLFATGTGSSFKS